MDKTKLNENSIFKISIKIQFFRCIYWYQNFIFLSFGDYWAGSLLTYSSLPRTVWFKKGTRNFNFRSNDSFSNIIGPQFWYDHPWGKKQKKAYMIFPLAKQRNSSFWRWELETFIVRFSEYTESDGMLFIKTTWCFDSLSLAGVYPFFRKSGKFPQARSLWWVNLYLEYYIWNQHNKTVRLIYWQQNSTFKSFGYYCAASLLT